MDGPVGELAALVVDTDERVAAADPGVGPQRVPPLPERRGVVGVGAPQRVTLEERGGGFVEVFDLVLADHGVAPVEVGRRDRASPHGGRRVVGVAPQRVVVAVRLGHVAEGVLVGPAVVGWLGMGLGDADAGPQGGDPVVGDGGRS